MVDLGEGHRAHGPPLFMTEEKKTSRASKSLDVSEIQDLMCRHLAILCVKTTIKASGTLEHHNPRSGVNRGQTQ